MNKDITFTRFCQTELVKFLKLDYFFKDGKFNHSVKEAIPDYQLYCKDNVMIALCKNLKEKRAERIKRNCWELRLQKFSQELRNGYINDETIIEALKKIWESFPLLKMTNSKGDTSVFMGRAKGTESYNKHYEIQIRNRLDAIAKLNMETYALTITCDKERYKNNAFEAWANYTCEIKSALEYLRKHHGLKYLWVKESTYKGFPHAHIVLAFPKGTSKGWDIMKNQQRVKYGFVYKTIKSRLQSPIFNLQCIKGNNIKFYLSKYISKGTNAHIADVATDNKELSKADRKCFIALLASLVTKSRLYGSTQASRLADDAEKNPEETQPPVDWANPDIKPINANDTDVIKKQKLARLRALLDYLCTNSPMKCACSILMTNNFSVQSEIKNYMKKKEKIPEDLGEIIEKCGKQQGCDGCLWSHLYNFVKYGDDTAINLYVKNPKNPKEKHRLFDGIDLKDDMNFFTAIYTTLSYYFTGIKEYGYSFNELSKEFMPYHIIGRKDDPEKNINPDRDIDFEEIRREQINRELWKRTLKEYADYVAKYKRKA